MSFDPLGTTSLIVLAIIAVLIIVVLVVRARFRVDPNQSARRAAQTKDMANYIRTAKAREQEAWSSVMTVMGEDERNLNSVYLDSSTAKKIRPTETSLEYFSSAPLTDLQKVFFGFWKIPTNKIPDSSETANRFIKAYKLKLRNDGYTHRVRRWERLEVLMGRFCVQHNVAELNERCERIGMTRPVLDVFLVEAMNLLRSSTLRWSDIATEEGYHVVLKHMNANHPQLRVSSTRNSAPIEL